MSGDIELVGSFADEHECIHGVEALRGSKIQPARVFTPFPSEHLTEALGYGRSPVRKIVLAGGITGVLTGIALTVGTSWEWNLIVGGKPVVSIPPFIIICFELMILFGGICGLLGFIFNAGLPEVGEIEGYNERFGSDRFGVVVRCPESDSGRVEALLKEAGAENVYRESA